MCSHGPELDILSTLNKGVGPEEMVLSLQHPLGSSDQGVGDKSLHGWEVGRGKEVGELWRAGHSGAGGWGGCAPWRGFVARDRMETEELRTQDDTCRTQHEAVKECLHSRSLLLAKGVPRTSGYHRG